MRANWTLIWCNLTFNEGVVSCCSTGAVILCVCVWLSLYMQPTVTPPFTFFFIFGCSYLYCISRLYCTLNVLLLYPWRVPNVGEIDWWMTNISDALSFISILWCQVFWIMFIFFFCNGRRRCTWRIYIWLRCWIIIINMQRNWILDTY